MCESYFEYWLTWGKQRCHSSVRDSAHLTWSGHEETSAFRSFVSQYFSEGKKCKFSMKHFEGANRCCSKETSLCSKASGEFLACNYTCTFHARIGASLILFAFAKLFSVQYFLAVHIVPISEYWKGCLRREKQAEQRLTIHQTMQSALFKSTKLESQNHLCCASFNVWTEIYFCCEDKVRIHKFVFAANKADFISKSCQSFLMFGPLKVIHFGM